MLACMALGAPKAAFADDAVDAGNGWSLTYTVEDGAATITGIAQAGSGELAIPAEAGGVAVTALATDAFRGSAVTTVTVPASIEGISAGCFRECTSLTDVRFENDTTGYLGVYAFAGCTALTSFSVPVLTSASKDYGGNLENYRIGSNCFLDCANLEKLEFLSDGGTTDGYFTDYSVQVMKSNICGGCDKLLTFVYFCQMNPYNRWNDTTAGTVWYFTVDFYASQEDAADYSKRVASVTCLRETPLTDILNGTVDEANLYVQSGAIPALPEGKMWGFSDYSRSADDWGLYNSCSVYPVDADDLTYGWVTSPEIKELTDKGWQDIYWDYERAVFVLDKAGTSVPGISGIVVHSADGSELDSSAYAIELEARIMGSGGIYTNDYEKVDAITSSGLYRVRAVASGSNSHPDSATDYVELKVNPYSLKSVSYATTGDAASAVASKHKGAEAYSVVVPSSSWQYAMIGAGLAAAGNGVLVASDASSISSASLRALIAAGSDQVLALGAGAQIGQSTIDQIKSQSLFANGGAVTPMTASSVQEMAVTVYNNIVKYGASSFTQEAAWGTSAIVMSPSSCFNTASIAQYALAKKAPVFFTEANGTLPADALAILSSGAFDEVVVAGSASLVPEATMAQISAAVPNTKRLLGIDASSGEVNRAYVEANAADLGADASKVVVASMADPTNVIVGAQLAVDNGAVLYTCASTEDGKAIQALADAGSAQNVWLVGSFGMVDSQITSRIASIATASPMSTAVGTGDTFEQAAVIYRIAGAGKAGLSNLFSKTASSLTVPATVAHNGTTYAITALDASVLSGYSALSSLTVASKSIATIPASLYKGMTNLKSVSYAAAVTSIGKDAFNGCTKLASVNANVLKANSIGANAFQNCKALKKLSFTSKKMTAIPASAFSGCTKLASLQFASTKIKSIGKAAFNGCSKLKTIVLKTAKLKKAKVGKNAFKGIAKKAKVKVPKKKVATYKKIFKAKGLPAKAKVVAG